MLPTPAFLSSPPQVFTRSKVLLKHPYQHTHTSQRSRAQKTEAAIDNHTIRFYTAAGNAASSC
jgi:predicted metallo-beta-lactamase superfamily hydrolase